MHRFHAPLIATLAAVLAGCATMAPPAGTVRLTGATYDADGMASVGSVPPSPWPAIAPPEPGKVETGIEVFARENGLTLAQAEERINGSAAFQSELTAVTQRLRADQSANFLEVRIVRDPAVRAEFAFIKDPAATLASYTRNPLFSAVQGGRDAQGLSAISALWLERLRTIDSPATLATDPFAGRIEIEPGLSEEEFRAIASERGWTWGNEVTFKFAPAPPPAQVDPAARYPFHLFPRSKAAATIVLTVAINGTILLDHGCFRLADRNGKPGDLVLFDRAAQVGTDGEGYLAVFDQGKVAARIGEPAVWGGYPAASERDPDVRRLRAQCGDGPIKAVGIPQSQRLFALPYPEWVADYARSKHIGYQAAWDRVIACMKRQESDAASGLAARDACIQQYN